MEPVNGKEAGGQFYSAAGFCHEITRSPQNKMYNRSMTTQTALKSISIDTFQPSNSRKVEMIVQHISAILQILGMDVDEEGLRETPSRVAHMYVLEAFRGLDPSLSPEMTLFENRRGYKQMLIEKGITFFSYCEHHLVPFFGTATVAYFPQEYIVGLSKLNRFVQYVASKPQTQEGLTVEIGTELQNVLHMRDVAVVLNATHLCIASRGVKDVNSTTRTSFFGGKFEDKEHKNELLLQIDSK